MRPEVQAFVADGPLPDWNADEKEIERRAAQLEAIPKPVTAQEAKALAACFGPDDCYGVAWSLLHLIETAPGPMPTVTHPGPDANEWHHTLWRRWESQDSTAATRRAHPVTPADDPGVHSEQHTATSP